MDSKTVRLIKKTIITLIGNFILAFGVYAFYTSTMGSDPISVLYDGIHVKFGISHGLAANYVSITGLIIAFIVARKYFYIGTLINAVSIGPFISISAAIYGMIFTGEIGLAMKIALVVAGIIILGLGIAITISVNMGPSFADCFVLKTQELTKTKYGIIRVMYDGLYTLSGFLLGGVVHLGTLGAVFFLGPVIQRFIPLIQNKVLTPLNIDYSIKG